MKKTITNVAASKVAAGIAVALTGLLLAAAPAGAARSGVRPAFSGLSGFLCPYDEDGAYQCADGDYGSGQDVKLYNAQDEWREVCLTSGCTVNPEGWPFYKGSGLNAYYENDPVVELQETAGGSGYGECIWANYQDLQTDMSGCSGSVLADLFVRVGSGPAYQYISVGQVDAQHNGAQYGLDGQCQSESCRAWTYTEGYSNYWYDWRWSPA